MSAQKSAKASKPSSDQAAAARSSSSVSSSSSLSSHLAFVELKQKILNSLSKIADRDTHRIGLEDLEKIIQPLSNDGVSIFLNCLCDAVNDPKPALKKEAVRLFAAVCAAHSDSAGTHLARIIACIVKRLKDNDSQVQCACLDAVGFLAGLYLKGGCGGDGVVSLFVKPLFEAMSENNKAAQSGAALGLAKVVECAADPPLSTFQKLLPRVCKYLNSPNFMAKASLLQVVSCLSQVGAMAPQSFEQLQQSIHVCLRSSDWATRKAAADSLIILGSKSGAITEEAASCTVKVLETCRFDKIKPVRETINKALLLWKNISGKADGSSDEHKISFQDDDTSEPTGVSGGKDIAKIYDGEIEKMEKGGNHILDKAVEILKKKAPTLCEKELNLEFFHKLETRISGDLPVEVMLPPRCVNASNAAEIREGSVLSSVQSERTSFNCHPGDPGNNDEMESSTVFPEFCRSSDQSEAFSTNKGNWLDIQRQLSLLERQHTHLMNMLQDFMDGSHDSMVTLENRVQGLERFVEEMARDLLATSSKRGGGASSACGHVSGRYIGLSPDYSWTFSTMRGGGSCDPENEVGHGVRGRAREKRAAGTVVRFNEGPSARSIWQASKDEATLEAIRVAGEEKGAVGRRGGAVPGTTAEASGDDGAIRSRNPFWDSWSNATDALQNGDTDSAYAEVISTGDDELLVKLMEKSGPVIDQLTGEVASEVIGAISQFLTDRNLVELCLIWLQQLADLVTEADIRVEVKRGIVVSLHELRS
ncbi:potyviral helper component protease-interacting protein 2, partial [Genlisea aurea]